MVTEFNVNPNPFNSMIDISITCANDKDCIILLADLQNSKIVRILGAGLNRGTNKISIDDLHLLETGDYHLTIKDTEGESLYATRLMKQ